jgi:hypothetical protein
VATTIALINKSRLTEADSALMLLFQLSLALLIAILPTLPALKLFVT